MLLVVFIIYSDNWSDTPRRSFDDYEESESSKPTSKSKSGGFHDEDTSEPEDGDSEFNSYKSSSNSNSKSNQQSGSGGSNESSPTTISAPTTINKPSSESRPSKVKSSEPSRKIDLGAAANYGKSQTINTSNDSNLIGSVISNNLETTNETNQKSKDLLDDIFSGISNNSPSKPASSITNTPTTITATATATATTTTTPTGTADDFADFASFGDCDGETNTTNSTNQVKELKVTDEFADFTSFDGNDKVTTLSTTSSIQKETKLTDEFADFAFGFTPTVTSASSSLTTPSSGVNNALLNSSFDLKAQSKLSTVTSVASNVNILNIQLTSP